MKTIHAIVAATLLLAPFAAHAQSAGTTTTTTDDTASTTTQDSDVDKTATATTDTDIGSSGTGTVGGDIGSSGTGTTGGDIGSTGTGTSGSDIGSSGTGTTSASGTPTYQPSVSLQAGSTSLRTPGTVQVVVVLAADAGLSPAQAGDIEVPLASSSAACTLPASVTVAWTSADGGTAAVDVACSKTRGTVTISSGSASTSFTAK